MGHNVNKMEMPKLACGAVVALGYAAACVSIYLNFRYGQRMSIDGDGYYINGLILLIISLGPAALTSYSGFAWRAGKAVTTFGTFAGACLLLLVTVYNTNDFLTVQMVGKVKAAAKQQSDTKDLTEVRNNLTLEERKELRESLRKKYDTARSKEERDEALAKLEALTNKPIELQATGPNVDLGARSNFLSRLFSMERDTVLNIGPAIAALAISAMELLLPFVGFSGWPAPRSEGGGSSVADKDGKTSRRLPSARLKPKTAKRDAYEDLRGMLKRGEKVDSQAMLARKWGVSEPTVHMWLAEWGVVKEPATTAFGRRNVITSLNGNGKMVLSS